MVSGRHGRQEFSNRTHPIREDMAFQQRSWLAERIAWGIMAAILVAALLGAFSRGPLSRSTASDGRLSVEYDRFHRSGAAARMQVRITGLEPGEEVSVSFDRALAEAFTFETVMPVPASSEADGGGLTSTFRASADTLNIYLAVNPDRAGLVNGRIALAGGDSVPLTLFIYP